MAPWKQEDPRNSTELLDSVVPRYKPDWKKAQFREKVRRETAIIRATKSWHRRSTMQIEPRNDRTIPPKDVSIAVRKRHGIIDPDSKGRNKEMSRRVANIVIWYRRFENCRIVGMESRYDIVPTPRWPPWLQSTIVSLVASHRTTVLKEIVPSALWQP